MGLGMVATAGAGVLSLAAMMNPTSAHADEGDVGLVLGGSGTPIPGPDYVASADLHYLEHVYPGEITSFFGATTANPLGSGLYTPEGLYPLTGVHTLPLNYPSGADGLPSDSTSVGQGITILANTIESYVNSPTDPETATVLGYSQSSTIAGLTMQQLEADGVAQKDVNFLLLGDPSNPNGGLLSRFDGFTTTSGDVHSLQLDLPSLGVSFDGATPTDDYVTSIYSMEYDGFTDFPKYPINFLSDLNAFLGIQTIHGTYLNGGNGTEGLGTGPSVADINSATLLPGSADYGAGNPASLTDYYMITTMGGTDTTPGAEITAPLVALLPKPLQELLGPDLTYLINLGYGDGSTGYSVDVNSPADVNTPFGLFPDVSGSQVLSQLLTDTQQGFQNLINGTDPYASATTALDPASTGQSMAEVMAALHTDLADPSATITELVNAITTASSAAYSTLLPTADIINALVTSMPAYDLSLFSANLANGDLLDAIGLPFAADTALLTLAGGFEVEVIQSAVSEISAAFSGLF